MFMDDGNGKVEWRLRLSTRSTEQLTWLVRALFATYDPRRELEFLAGATVERAIDDLYNAVVKEL